MILNQEEYKFKEVWMMKKWMIKVRKEVHKRKKILKKKKSHMKMRMKIPQDQTQKHHLGRSRKIILKAK